MTIVCAIFPRAVIRIYTDIPDLIEATVPSMLVVLSSYLLTVGAQVCFQAVSGTGSTKTAFRLEIVALTIYICYCTVVDAKVRHRHLLDFRACLFALRPAAELVLPEKRPLEKQESISRPAKISDQSGLKGEGISIMTFPADYQERGLFLS